MLVGGGDTAGGISRGAHVRQTPVGMHSNMIMGHLSLTMETSDPGNSVATVVVVDIIHHPCPLIASPLLEDAIGDGKRKRGEENLMDHLSLGMFSLPELWYSCLACLPKDQRLIFGKGMRRSTFQ